MPNPVLFGRMRSQENDENVQFYIDKMIWVKVK